MADIYNQDQPTEDLDFPEEEESLLSFFLNNLGKIVIGLILVTLVIGAVIYVIRAQSTPKKTTNTPSVVSVTPSYPKETNTQTTQTNTNQPKQTQTKSFTENTYRYTITTPQNWETFTRLETASGKQIGIRPVGSTDIPITINAQPNPNLYSADEVANMLYGSATTRSSISVKGKNAVQIVNGNYKSTIITSAQGIFEIVGILTNADATSAYQTISSSFSN